MFEEDFIMRIIKQMIQSILKFYFDIDTENPYEEFLSDENTDGLNVLRDLTDMADEGKINQAENKLFDIISEKSENNLKLALLFYSHLNGKTVGFLEKHDFSREEIADGLRDVAKLYGIDTFSDVFLK